jgi:VIT1/CCC1 family predicted Fe2+/Mn2+ transporter
MSDEHEPGARDEEENPRDERSSGARAPAPVVGPVAGAMIGIVTFFALGDRFSLPARLGLSLAVIAVVAYVSLLLARRR